MSNSSRTKWEAFFIDAGIPQKQATEYASTFSNNRMRLDMLEELNKDLLRDLGIKALGDIITILRHAKKRGFNVHRSPSPESSVHSNSKQPEKIKSSVSLPTGAKTSYTNAKTASKTIVQKMDPRNKPVKDITSGSIKVTQNTNRTGMPVNRTGVTPANKASTAIGRVAAPSCRVGVPTVRTGVSYNVNSDASGSKLSSKSAVGKPRLKLSDRFDGFEVEAKRIKIDKQGGEQVPGVQSINVESFKPKTVPAVRCINIEERFRTRLATEGSHLINSKDERKEPLRPTIVTALKGTPVAKPVQFTVQVPSKPPMNASNTAVVSKPNIARPNVTVVPARGKALNREKQMTSIFDRLDAPSSSSVAAELLNDESSNQKNNVFRRLGCKSDKPKTEIDDIKITTGVTPSIQVDNKHGSDSVFRRLGAPQTSNM